MSAPARDLWRLAEPLHALIYFAPEAHEAFENRGLRGFWRGYFAGRAAPMGAVSQGVVTATFFGFHPAFVARAIPSIWSRIDPATAIEARLAGIDAALRRIFPDARDDPLWGHAADLLRFALQDCDTAGRPLFGANLDLEWPSEGQLALWHAATLLREHRGGGHVAALVAAGVGPCEAHLTQVRMNDVPLDSVKPYRGWGEEDYAAAAEGLRTRGWLTDTGRLTDAGREARRAIEADTDRLAADPLTRLGPEGLARVSEVLAPAVSRLRESGAIPYPNPMGVPPPDGW